MLGVAILQWTVPAPPPGAGVPVLSVAGTQIVTRVASGTTVLGFLPVVPMTIVSAALMLVVSWLTPAAVPQPVTLNRYRI